MQKSELQNAVDFHGHLGPYLVLGILAGKLALKRLGCKKYFDLDVKVWGASKRPKSCLIDGLQLSSGATYGKGNIHKLYGKNIRILFKNLKNQNEMEIALRKDLINKLGGLEGHKESEKFAIKLSKRKPENIFNLETGE